MLSSLALCCLASAMNRFLDEERYGSIMERMPVLYDEWALTKRDVCADAIPGTITSFCTPGKTLCCTPNNTNSAYPQCQSFLGSGFCCVSANNCYIDTNSDCAASNSISCRKLRYSGSLTNTLANAIQPYLQRALPKLVVRPLQ